MVKFALPKNNNLLPHPRTINTIGRPFIELSSVDSTNNYAMAQAKNGLAHHGTVYFAKEQTAGKGQRGKRWNSNKGENIILSAILDPEPLTIINQFMLSATVSLACYDFFKVYVKDQVSVKWPNDLFWCDRKAGGILIENLIRGSSWDFAIAGIGININQTLFPETETAAVSLKQISGQTFLILELAKELCNCLEIRFHSLFSKDVNAILTDYNSILYKKDKKVRLRKDSMVFETTIVGVSSKGYLITKDRDIEREFAVGEVVWI